MDPLQKLDDLTEGTFDLKNSSATTPLNRAESQFATGTVIGGHYKILDFIGAGGMSRVYKCEDLTISRIIAIKTLQLGASDDATRRVQVEGKAIARLEHPNIVKLYGLQVLPDGAPMLMMEYIAGKTLAQILESGNALSVQRAMRIAAQICAGLSAAHLVGVVHRDLKPSNIMLLQAGGADEKVKLLDFGIAKIQEESPGAGATRTGEIFGTPTYMSPEQALGKRCGPQTDQYSLGCVLYEMLTGKPPFSGGSQLEIMMAHVQEPVVPIDKVSKKQIPRHLIEAIHKLLEKNPADRFATIDDATRALFNPGLPVSSWKPRKIMIAAGTLIALIGLGAIGLWQWQYGTKAGNATHSESGSDSHHVADNSRSSPVESQHDLSRDDLRLAEWVGLHRADDRLDSRSQELLTMPHVTDEGLRCLEQMTKLQFLDVSRWQLTGSSLKYLINLPLKDLDLENMDLKTSDIRNLTRIQSLKKLNLGLSTIDDQGCKLLAGLKNLEELHLDTTNISPNALVDISHIESLRSLYVNNDKVGGGFANLYTAPLKELSVSAVNLNHKDIQDIARIKTLRSLFIGNTEIDDKDLLVLAKLPALEQLFVTNCAGITRDGLRKFSDANDSDARVFTDKNWISTAGPRSKKTGPNLLSNPSFEIGKPLAMWQDIQPGNKMIPGWTVSQGSIGVVGKYWHAADGDTSIELNGAAPGTIEQTFKTVPGATYVVNFVVSRNPATNREFLNFRISAAGQSKEFRIPGSGQHPETMLWQPTAWQFVASSTRTTLAFRALSDGQLGAAIDNVTVYATK